MPLILLRSSRTLSNEVKARSGRPYDALATPAPDMYKALIPDFSANNAEYGFMVPAIDKGWLSFMALKIELSTKDSPLKFSLIHYEKMLLEDVDILLLCV